ncbi:MAG: Holliday junction resolvase RuvX [Deltaproteobacteria bacterium]|nr:MAG: Holliday junction resolvase RuvX [Deltaproteobacteria bacterium]
MGRVMGIDFGLARIGVALSDPTRTLASPLTTVHEKDKGAQIRRVAALIAEHEVTQIVIGIPYQLDGVAGEMAELAEKFATKLESTVEVPIARWDERFSSVTAEDALRVADAGRRKKKRSRQEEKGRIDAAAAAVLLQEWLDGPGSRA